MNENPHRTTIVVGTHRSMIISNDWNYILKIFVLYIVSNPRVAAREWAVVSITTNHKFKGVPEGMKAISYHDQKKDIANQHRRLSKVSKKKGWRKGSILPTLPSSSLNFPLSSSFIFTNIIKASVWVVPASRSLRAVELITAFRSLTWAFMNSIKRSSASTIYVILWNYIFNQTCEINKD